HRVGASSRDQLEHSRAHAVGEVRATHLSREVHREHAHPAQAGDVGEKSRRLDDLAVAHRDALLVDLPRVGGDLAGGELPHLGEASVVQLARLVQAARAVVEAEALLPRRPETLPPAPWATLEL